VPATGFTMLAPLVPVAAADLDPPWGVQKFALCSVCIARKKIGERKTN
jgi:hypothetical protein